MCWYSNELKKHISNGTVKIFKICWAKLNCNPNKVTSYYYYGFHYDLNKIYKTDIHIQKCNSINSIESFRGDYGFHSYSPDKCFVRENDFYLQIYIHQGKSKGKKKKLLDEYYTLDCHDSDLRLVYVEGYIPKGGTYYINDNGEIISDSIVLTKIIDN